MPTVQPGPRLSAQPQHLPPLPPSRQSSQPQRPSAVSLDQLPSVIARVGASRAQQGSKWTQGPQLVTSALGTELPPSAPGQSVSEPEVESAGWTQGRTDRTLHTQPPPLTVSQVLLLLSTGGHHAGPQVFYLKEGEGPVSRPYDLRVVAPSEAGPEHYIFCRSGVLHVTLRGHGGMTSLAEWYREAVYWDALHKLPFFRLFGLRKAFCRWRVTVRCSRFNRRRRDLQSLMLSDGPGLTEALLVLNTAMEEFHGSLWLPPGGSYTLLQFSDALKTHKRLFLCKLRDLSQTCHVLLHKVQGESRELCLELQQHIEVAQQAKYFSGSIGLHVMHLKQLQGALRRAQHSLSKLPSFIQRVHYMTVHCLVSAFQQHVSHFIYDVLQKLEFLVELRLSSEGQLTVEPPLHLFLNPLKDLLSTKHFILQACDSWSVPGQSSAQRLVHSGAVGLGFSEHLRAYQSTKTWNSVTSHKFLCCQMIQQQQNCGAPGHSAIHRPSGTSPGLTGTSPGPSGTSLGQPGTSPGLTGTSPGPSGTSPGPSGTSPGQPGTPLGQTGTSPVLRLSRELLEWTLSMCDMSQPMGAAESLLQEESGLSWLFDRFSWLMDVHHFVDSLRLYSILGGQPAEGGAPRGQSVEGGALRGQSAVGGAQGGQSVEGGAPRDQSAERGAYRAQSAERGALRCQSAERGALRGQSAERGALRCQSAERGALRGQSADGGALRGQSAERGAPRGQSADGGTLRGQSAVVGAPRGQCAEGGPPRDQSAERRTLKGQSAVGGAPRGQSAEGGALKGQSAEGGALSGQSAEGGALGGQSAERGALRGQSAESGALEGQSAEGSALRGQSAEGGALGGQSAERGALRGQSAESGALEGQSAEGSALRGQSAEGGALGGQSAEGSALRGQAAEGSALRGQSAEGGALRGQSAKGGALRGQSAEGSALMCQSAEGGALRGQSAEGGALRGQSAEGGALRGQSAEGGSLRGQSVFVYKENILQVHRWLKALGSAPASVISPKNLFSISCTSVTHKLERQLQLINEEILKQLEEQVQVCSERLLADLQSPSADDQLVGQNFPQYFLKVQVQEWFSLWAETSHRLDYARSVQELIVTHYRALHEEELRRRRQVESLWDNFLLLLKNAESAVCQGLPVHRKTLDIIFSFVYSDLTQMVSQISQEVYLDLEQNAAAMASALRVLYTHVQTRWARLEQITETFYRLHEVPKDVSSLNREMEKVKGRTQLWETLASCNTWTDLLEPVPFTKMDVVRARAQLEERTRSIVSVSTCFPPEDPLLQRTVHELEQQRHQLELMTRLVEPHVKPKHWRAVLKGLGLRLVKLPELTVGQLLSRSLGQHSALVRKICLEAKAERDMETDFQSLQKQWTEKRLTLESFSPTSAELHGPDGACGPPLWIVTDLDVRLAETRLDSVTVSDMLKSQLCSDFKAQLADWLQLMHDLDNSLLLFQRLQRLWIFFTKVLNDGSLCVSQTDVLPLFQKVDASFQRVIKRVSSDSRVLSLHDEDFCQILSSALSALDVGCGPMVALLDSLRAPCARLRFLSDRGMVEMFSSEAISSALCRFVRVLFPGVEELQAGAVEDDEVCCSGRALQKVSGVFGSLRESVTFDRPVELRPGVSTWLCELDRQLRSAMVDQMRACSTLTEHFGLHSHVLCADKMLTEAKLSSDVSRQILHVLSMFDGRPRQCVLVAEEATWCRVLAEAFPRPVRMNNLKLYLRTRVSVLGRHIRDRRAQEEVCGVTPDRAGQFLRILVQITMNRLEHISHLQKVEGHSSFEWLTWMKYHLSVDDDQELLCFVDVLNCRFHYGYEYVGAGDWIVPQTPSTDRAKLGILLALSKFRCGLVNGPCKSAQKHLVVQLAMALGRMAFVLECGPSVRQRTVENLLLGSLQVGAWLILDSANRLSDKVASALGQSLNNIHESFSKVTDTNMSKCQVHMMCSLLRDMEIPASHNYGCVLVSANAQDIPGDLRVASRPVALTHPDYEIIAEVMLTSLGFIDAKYLSRRLDTLVRSVDRCMFLPGSKTKKDCCIFLILQNIIVSSMPYLEQCRRQRKSSEGGTAVFKVVQSLMEEAAVVKSVMSVLVPWSHELNKVTEFQKILKDVFPIVCQFQSLQHYLEEFEINLVKAAVGEALQTNGLQPHTELINNALTIYQNLKSHKTVILSGPSGSGKTSCYSLLAGALNALAKSNEQSTASSGRLVNPVVLFVNSLSFLELFGFDCERRGWQDGALTRFLRSCGQAKGVQNWLILDGDDLRNPAEKQSWMDTIASVCHSPDWLLSLASGEWLLPPHEQLQVLFEVSDLSSTTPSALTACSLVHFTGTELWRAAWKGQMKEIYEKHSLDKEVEEMWESLAEDLFPATLRLLRDGSSHTEAGCPRRTPEGLQEVMSFSRILMAFLQHFEVYLSSDTIEGAEEPTSRGSRDGMETSNTNPGNKTETLAQKCFLIAYSWGFGGHLDSSVWPRFQRVARDVLGRSRYHIQVPEGESVFEYFFTSDSRVRLQTTALAGHSPKYGVYTHLLHIMLEARQPVLLTGEPGSGKSTLCRRVLSLSKPSVTLSGSAVLSPSDLLTVFWSCHAARPSNLLLFVDDLHLAVSDAPGNSSQVLEMLRQSISTSSVVTFSQSSPQLLRTAALSYLCTSSTPPHGPALSPRLTRLCSVLTLPSLTPDVIFSLYSPSLKLWMSPLVQNVSQMVSAIISATHSLYLALLEHFRHAAPQHCFLFSFCDVQKVFQGMTLWQSTSDSSGPVCAPGVQMLQDIVKLWLHECTHTFVDRVHDEEQHAAIDGMMVNLATTYFGRMLEPPNTESFTDRGSSETCFTTDCLHAFVLECVRNVRCNVAYSPDVSASLSSLYKEYSLDVIADSFQSVLDTQASEDPHHNMPHTYVMHRQRARQLAHILRLLLVPGAHAVLLASDRGTGRKTTTRCAAALSGCHLLELHSANQAELPVVLREASDRSRVQGARVLLLVHQDVSADVRERLLVVMAQSGSESYMRQQLTRHISTVTATDLSQKYHHDHRMLLRFLDQMHKNIHIILLLPTPHTATPHTSTFHTSSPQASSLYDTQTIRAVRRSSCVEVYRPWSFQTLVSTAAYALQSWPNSGGAGGVRRVAGAMACVHLSALHLASAQLTILPFTPATFLRFIQNFCHVSRRLQARALQQSKRAAALEEVTNIIQETMFIQNDKIRCIKQKEQALLEAVGEQERRLQDALDTCALEGGHLEGLQRDMQRAQLQEVVKASSLDGRFLEEVRRYRDPPDPVVLVLDAVCTLFQRPLGWDSAKLLLSQDNFYQELEYFDHRRVSRQQLRQLEALVHRADFDPLIVREASQACESLCRWVLAVYECCLCPNHHEAQPLELQALEAKERLSVARRQEGEALNCLSTLQLQLGALQQGQLTAELQQAVDHHRQAAGTMAKLQQHSSVWDEHTQKSAEMMEAVPGDALLIASILSYGGPFGADTRSQLVTKWTNPSVMSQFCCGLHPAPSLPVSAPLQAPFARVLGVSERRLQGVALSNLLLPLLLWNCTHNPLQLCPLLVDPHHRLDEDTPGCCLLGEQTKALQEFELQLCADDPDLVERLEQAQAEGTRVLVRDAERAPSCPRLLSLLPTPLRPGCAPPETCPPAFGLIFVTTVPAHRLTREMPGPLLHRLSVVDLSLDCGEMETFFQTQLLVPENSALLRQWQRLQQRRQRLTDQLVSKELAVMDYISEKERPLLQDSAFADKVCVFHEESEELQEELGQVEGALSGYSEVLERWRPLFALTVGVYRALQQVAVLSPAYSFSLEGFVCVVKGALSERAGELGSQTVLPGAVTEELSQQLVSQVLVCYEPSLFKEHTQVLRLLLCLVLMQHRQICSPVESQAFLRGLATGHHLTAQTQPQTCPECIPARIHPGLWCLEQLPAFRGLLSSLRSAPGQWQEYLSAPSTVSGPVPVRPFTGLSLLQRALLWKTLRPESLQHVAEDMAACLLSVPRPCGSLQCLSQLLLLHGGPVFLSAARPSGTQPLQLISQLALSEQVCLKVICSCDQASIVSALNTAPKEGLWLVFTRGHFLRRWDRPLLAEINRFTQSRKDSMAARGLGCLRLWFISPVERLHLYPCHVLLQSPGPALHLSLASTARLVTIWVVVRAQSLVLVCDSPWGLAEEVAHSQQLMDQWLQSQSEPELHKGALTRCALFHSVLLQRQSALNRSRWTDLDLVVLGEAYSSVAVLCSDPMEALQHLAVRLVHGGRVLDTADLEELRCVALTYLTTGPPSHHASLLDGPLQDDMSRRGAQCLGFGEDICEELLFQHSHRLEVLLRESQSPSGRSAQDMSTVCLQDHKERAESRLQRLRAVQDYLRDTRQNCRPRPGSVPAPLWDFLQTEWDMLWATVSSQVSVLGLSPPSWTELQAMERRSRLLSSYLWPQDGPDPVAYRLSVFTNPTGLLLAIRRHYAQIQRRSVADVTLLFQVVGDPLRGGSMSSLPPETLYLCGLELRGAAWDSKVGALRVPQREANPLPLLSVRPAPPSTDGPLSLPYLCPLYLEPGGLSSLSQEEGEVVVWVPLSSMVRPEACSLRRVRIVSIL